MTGKEIEGTGIGKERKKTREVGDEIVTTIRKEARTEKRTESDPGNGPRNGEVGVRWKKKNIKMTKMIDGIEMTKKIPRKRKNTVEAEAEKGNTEVGVEAGTQGSGAGAGAKRRRASIKVKARKSPANGVAVAVKGGLTVLKRRESGSAAPAERSPEGAAEAKSAPTGGITVTARTSLTDTTTGGAKAQSRRARTSSTRTETRLCEHFL